jgi:hypothetical protein
MNWMCAALGMWSAIGLYAFFLHFGISRGFTHSTLLVDWKVGTGIGFGMASPGCRHPSAHIPSGRHTMR